MKNFIDEIVYPLQDLQVVENGAVVGAQAEWDARHERSDRANEVRDSCLDAPEWDDVARDCDAVYELSRLLEYLHDGKGGLALALKDELLREYSERQAQKYGEG